MVSSLVGVLTEDNKESLNTETKKQSNLYENTLPPSGMVEEDSVIHPKSPQVTHHVVPLDVPLQCNIVLEPSQEQSDMLKTTPHHTEEKGSQQAPPTQVSVTITQPLTPGLETSYGKLPSVNINTTDASIEIDSTMKNDSHITAVRIVSKRVQLHEICSKCTCPKRRKSNDSFGINALTDFTALSDLNNDRANSGEMLHFIDGSGECIPMENATIGVRVGKYDIPSLMDSGAFASCINDKFAHKLQGGNTVVRIENCDCRIFTADNTRRRVKKRALIQLHVGKRRFEQWCYIIPGLQRSLILGVDFLKKNRICLEFGNDVPTEYVIRAPKKVVMPPLAEVLMGGQILSSISLQGQLGVTENISKGNTAAYLVQRSLVIPQSDKNIIPIKLFNPLVPNRAFQRGFGTYLASIWHPFRPGIPP